MFAINAAAALMIVSTMASTKIADQPASQVQVNPAPVSGYCVDGDDNPFPTMVSTNTAGQSPAAQAPAKPAPMSGCYDSDGGDNPAVPGYVIDAVGGQTQDYCFNSGLLLERICNANGTSGFVQHNCTCVSEWINVPFFGPRYTGKCQQ